MTVLVPMPQKNREASPDGMASSIRFRPAPRNPKKPTDIVDLRPLKRVVDEFPPRHPLRMMIAEEPDQMQFWESAVVAPRWFLLLTKWHGE